MSYPNPFINGLTFSWQNVLRTDTPEDDFTNIIFENVTIIISTNPQKYPIGAKVPSIGIFYQMKATIELFDANNDPIKGQSMTVEVKPF